MFNKFSFFFFFILALTTRLIYVPKEREKEKGGEKERLLFSLKTHVLALSVLLLILSQFLSSRLSLFDNDITVLTLSLSLFTLIYHYCYSTLLLYSSTLLYYCYSYYYSLLITFYSFGFIFSPSIRNL